MEFNFESDPELKQFYRTDVKRTRRVLGNGSFGIVEQVTLSGAPCAAKKLHSILIEPQNIGTEKLIENFKRECRIMSILRHPNVVRFLGLCTFEESLYPVLLMDCLDICLHDFLTTPGRNTSLSMETKISILKNVAAGLTYLHSHHPQIIHRDLTAKNILLVLPVVQAKIGDLGNSRMLSLEMPLTELPGTMVYMPPEAFGSSYDSKIDIFSFGHLALFTILQEFPSRLLYHNQVYKGNLVARSEVQRRGKYFSDLESLLGDRSPMVRLIEECLNNEPQRRPTADEVAQKLRKQITTSSMDFRVKERNIGGHFCEAKTKLIQTGSPGLLELRKSPGGIIKRREMWKQFIFQITERSGDRFLRYYKNVSMDRVMGELKISSMTTVKKRTELEFEINSEGNSLWILRAHEEEERMCWMEAIVPGSSQLFTDPPMPLHPPMYDIVDGKHGDSRQQQEMYPGLGRTEEGYRDFHQQRYPQPTYKPPLPPKPKYKQPEQQRRKPAPPIDKTQSTHNDPETIYAEQLRVKFSQEQLQQLLEMFQTLSNKPRTTDESVQVKQQATGGIEETSPRYQNVKESKQQYEKHARKVPAMPHIPHQKEPKPSHQHLLFPTREQMMYCGSAMKNASPHHSPYPSPDHSPHPSPHHSPYPSPYQSPHSSPHHSPYPSPYQSPHSSPHHSPHSSPDTSPQHLFAQIPIKVDGASLGRVLSQSPAVSPKMLLTDDRQLYSVHSAPRPQWTRASPHTSLRITPQTSPHAEVLAYSQDKLRDGTSGLTDTFFISEHDLSEMALIKSGQFGSVSKARLRTRGNIQVAVKTMQQYKSESESREFICGMQAIFQLKHPNIVKLCGFVEKKFWLVLEYLPKGDLKNFLTNHKCPVRLLTKYMIDVAMGMHCLTEKGLIHRDLAARNILVCENEICKVADFGLICKLPDDQEYYIASKTAKKPVRWMAPESIKQRKYSHASDVWSFGVLQWEMFNPTKIPYEDLSNMQCMTMIVSGYRMEIPQECPETVADIMKACWLSRAAERPSFLFISLLLAKLHVE